MENIKAKIQGKEYEFPKGTSIQAIADTIGVSDITVLAIVNNNLKNFCEVINEDSEIKFLDITSDIGYRVYQRSVVFLLAKAVKDLFPEAVLSADHSISSGLYCELLNFRNLRLNDIEKIESRMKELVDQDIPFIRKKVPTEEAIKRFRERKQEDKALMFEQERDKEYTALYSLDDYEDYFFGYLVPSTKYLKNFSLKYYMPGFIILFVDRKKPDQTVEFVEQPKLFNILRESGKWVRIHNVQNVSMLNKYIREGYGGELIRIAEGLHEKKIAMIADNIANDIDRIRLVMIAGPSSSGKTTFSQRLSVQLKVNGLHPVNISLDDYFVNREFTPIDEEGNYDYESIDSINIKLFNEHLTRLIQGEEVELPKFDFIEGVGKPSGEVIRVDEKQPIIIEGIHGLNDILTSSIPRSRKYYIYISALTQLNLDYSNRIKTTDARLLRRMVRDVKYRGNSAEGTFEMWPRVRKGENRNIFPYQENADIMFNSHLVYEMAVLKAFAEPLMKEITQESIYYPDAKQILNILDFFEPYEYLEDIPNNSIIREFIGLSCFYDYKE